MAVFEVVPKRWTREISVVNNINEPLMKEFVPKQSAQVQASEVNYELYTLGWRAFQNLCLTIASEIWGQSIQSFCETKDGGRDGAFYGKVTSPVEGILEGSFTIQCKFTSKQEKSLQLADIRDELEKAHGLGARGLATNYFLFTNHSLTGIQDENLRSAFLKLPGVRQFAVYGRERISQIIQESSRLRMLVPRIYGLGDLSQILDERSYAQAKEVLSAMGDDLAKFVVTNSYHKSAKALIDCGFVLLLGEPACGKSMVAAALALGALDEWRCFVLRVRNAEEFIRHYNPHEPKQFFWVDDAFGATQFDWEAAAAWNGVFPTMHAAIQKGTRILFTSRSYIYKSARNHLKDSTFLRSRESQVVIHVEKLTEGERQQILYNHIRFGDQPQDFKKKIKPLLTQIALHRQFKPEIARRLGNRLFTKNLTISESQVFNFFENPVEFLCEILRTLDSSSLAAVSLVFMAGGYLLSPIDINDETKKTVELIGGTLATVLSALDILEGSLLKNILIEGNYYWGFKHPTIQDAFATLVSENRELLDIYVKGTSLTKLLREISCGVHNIDGVKVIVPLSRYSVIIDRILDNWERSLKDHHVIYRFLAHRCDESFLKQFITKKLNFVDTLCVRSMLYATAEISVIICLQRFGLLPKEKYESVVGNIKRLAVEVPDSSFLQNDIHQFLGDDNVTKILDAVKKHLIPTLKEKILDERFNYELAYGDPEDYFDYLISALKDYKDKFASDTDVSSRIDEALEFIEETIEELKNEKEEEPESDDFHGGSSHENFLMTQRSVFDDVDH